MMAGLLTLLGTLIMVTQVMAGAWTSNNFLYKPATGAKGEAEKANFESGLNRVDSRLAKEIWLGDPGGTPGYDTLDHALTTISTTHVTLRIPAGTVAIATDTTIPANVTLKPERGATLAIATTKTLTINGPLEAGLYQIFSCAGTGKVVYKGRKYPEWWGAKDDSGTTDCTAAFKAALLNGGLIRVEAPNGGYYKCTTALPTSVATTRVFSESKAEIRQATARTKLFLVSADDVKFRRLRLSGVDTVDTGALYSDMAPIYSEATKLVPLDNLEVTDCEISDYEAGVRVPWTNAKIANNYIHDVANGVIGGTGAYTPADQNLNGAIHYDITGNNIICTFGALSSSRPIAIPCFTGGAIITGNYLRGGGMSIENALGAPTSLSIGRFIVTGNDCDTAISVTSLGGIVGYNQLDLAQAPAGRGQQSAFFPAIEVWEGGTVVGNIVRNHTNGVGNVMQNMRVIGNFFYNCGDQGGGEGVGMGGVVVTATNNFAADSVMNTVIANNTFNGTKGAVADIYMNWSGTYSLLGLTISDNQSYGCHSFFYLGTNILNSKVSGNFVQDCQTGQTGAAAVGMRNSGVCSVEFLNNTFINTLSAPNGMYVGIMPQTGDIIGFNKCTGMRAGALFDYWDIAPKVLCSHMAGGAMFSPRKGSFTATAGVNTVVGNIFVTATCRILLEPSNAAAATLMTGANSFYVSNKTAGTSFQLATAGGGSAAGTETFNYEIMD